MNVRRIVLLLLHSVASNIALLVMPPSTPNDYGSELQPPSNVAIIYCVVSNTSAYTTRWFADNKELNAGGRYAMRQGIEGNGSNITELVIVNVTYEDTANYTCVVSSLNAQENSSVTQRIVFPSKLKLNGSVTYGSNYTLVCELSQYLRPDSSLVWYHNEEGPLLNGSKYNIRYISIVRQTRAGGNATSRLSILTICNFTASDTGEYSCHLGDMKVSVQFNGTAAQSSPIKRGNTSDFFTTTKGTSEQQKREPVVAASVKLNSLAVMIIACLLCALTVTIY